MFIFVLITLFLNLSFLEIRAERRQKSISVELSFAVVLAFNPFSARGPIYRPPLFLRRMREADVWARFFQALQ
jgi:hypothetical protein